MSPKTFSPFYISYGIEPSITPVYTVFKSKSKPETEFLENIKVASTKAEEPVVKSNENMFEYKNCKRCSHQLKFRDFSLFSMKSLKFEGKKKLSTKFFGP